MSDTLAGFELLNNALNNVSNTITYYRTSDLNAKLNRRAQDLEYIMSREAQDFEKAENELAYLRDIEMWNMQNQYNSPIEQMKRYQEAGLNPNLIYGQGTPGNAQNMPTYSATKATKPDIIPPYMRTPYEFKSNMLQTYQILSQIKQTDAQTRAIDEQTDFNIITKNARVLQETYKAQLDAGAITHQEYQNKLQDIAYQVELATKQNKIDLSANQVEMSNIEKQKLSEELNLLILKNGRQEVENAMYELGLEGDNPISMMFRFVARGLVTDFSELRELINKNKSKLPKTAKELGINYK